MKLKLAAVVCLFALCFTASAFADSLCATASLSTYATTSSCTLGNLQFFFNGAEAFLYRFNGPVSSQPISELVTVTPYINGQQVGFTFSGLPSVSPTSVHATGQQSEAILRFSQVNLLNGATITGAGAQINGSNLYVYAQSENGYDSIAWNNGGAQIRIGNNPQAVYGGSSEFFESTGGFYTQETSHYSHGTCSANCADGYFRATNFASAHDDDGSGRAFADATSHTVYFTTDLDNPTQVPEPSSLILLGSGLLGCARVVRSRFKS